jgi:hypothetical protein
MDKETANDPGSWSVLSGTIAEQRVRQQALVGRPRKQGYDTLEVKKATLLADGKTVFLEISGCSR